MNYKSHYALAIFSSLLCFQKVQAQVDVTAQPLGLLFGIYNFSGDFYVSDNFSVEAVLGFTSRSGTVTDSDTGEDADVDYTSVPVMAMGKYYFNPRNGADRFYLSAFLRYVNRKVQYSSASDNADVTWSRFGVGFGVGTKIVSQKGVVLDLGLGIGRAFVDKISYDNSGDQQEIDWPGLIVLPRLAVGYRFGG